MVKRHDPAVVFLDIGMPGMNGYETAAAVAAPCRARRRACWWRSPAGAARPDQARSLAAGFDLHLTKPVDIDKVQRVLAAVEPPAARACA